MRSLIFLVALSACSSEIESPDPGVDGGAPIDIDARPAQMVDIEGPTVLPHVQAFANAVCTALGSCTISTYAGHDPVAERAIDILVSDEYGMRPTDNNALGDATAQFALDHVEEFGVMYVIFRQRYNGGSGWRDMEDRGSITQNHYDHVHVSFDASL